MTPKEVATDVAMKAAILVRPIFVSTVSEKKTKKSREIINMKASLTVLNLMIFNAPSENMARATHPKRS